MSYWTRELGRKHFQASVSARRLPRLGAFVELESRAVPATITGQVFNDFDGDGAIDGGEPGLASVPVFLDTDNDGVIDLGPSTTFTTSPGTAIPTIGTITSNLVVAGSGTIADVNVKLNIAHTWDADLTVSLKSPSGTSITLFGDVGGEFDNFTNTVLDDEAAVSIGSGTAPFTGTFRPEPGPLSAFDNQTANGTWVLTIVDSVSGDGGTLQNWSLTIAVAGETTTTTNASGNYTFTGLAAGSYNVAHIVPSGGFVQTFPGGDGRHHPTLAASDTFTGNFGDRLPPATISGLVYNDLDGSKTKNGSEPAVPGVTVYLDIDTSGTFNAGDISTTSAADGTYKFSNVVPGKDYIVAEVVPGGFTHTAPLRNGLVPLTNVNVSKRSGDQSEANVAIDPTNPNRVFASANNIGATGMSGSVSVDGGATWTNRLFGTGGDGYTASIGDPVHAFDKFGNLWGAQLSSSGINTVVGLSKDGGKSFATFFTVASSTDQPTITTGNSNTAGNALVALCFNKSSGQYVSYLQVNAAGPIGTFTTPVLVPSSNSGISGNFGDIAIGPNGQVAIAYQHGGSGQGPDTIFYNIDPDGIGASPFGARLTLSSTNVGGFDFIPAQPQRSVDAEVDVEWDSSGGPFNGRLYALYTEETVNENNDMNILLRISNNNGASFGAPVKIHNDATTRSQFLPRMSVDNTTGNVAFSWYDCRNDPGNILAEYWATASFDGGATFQTNIKLSSGQSTAVGGDGNDYGDYSGLSFTNGRFIASWADNANTTKDNPGPASTSLDQYIARVNVASNQPNHFVSAAAGQTYANLDFGIKGPALSVTDFTVNDGDAQRSRLLSVRVTFGGPVTPAQFAATGAITLTRTAATPAGTVGTLVQTGAAGANGLITVTQPGPADTIDLTFSNANGANVTPGVEYTSLADGRWQLAIPGAAYLSPLGDTRLRRLFGDVNNDGTVDGTDFGVFGTSFGGTSVAFDFDNNTPIDGIDFGELGARFGLTL